MPGEFSDLENCSDLENLLALAEEEFQISSPVKVEIDTDCKSKNMISAEESVKLAKTAKPQSSITTTLKSICVSTTAKVQRSISEFFKAPKRLPDEIVRIETVGEKRTKLATGSIGKVIAKGLPKFKLIPGTPFAVDAFSYGQIAGITGYFLTHFHSDHYKGLSNKLFDGTTGLRLYCTPVTGNLVRKELRIRGDVITSLEIGRIYVIKGIHVGVLDANHCPGSVMFVFGVPSGCGGSSLISWHLHCGDFRANSLILNQKLRYSDEDKAPIHFTDFMFDSVYLDTTYAHPKHCFPPQEQVIGACVDGCSRLIRGQAAGKQQRLVPLKWLIAVGSYLIGKERIILALAETFDLLIYADARKRSILRLLQWPELEDRLTDDPLATPLHFVSMGLLAGGTRKLSDYRDSFQGRFSHVVGIKPTGWTFTASISDKLPEIEGTAGIWPVPYSEHSSYKELNEFLQAISVHRIIPTVDNYRDIVLDTRRIPGSTPSALLQQWSQRR